jgi:hypothetical protein
MINQRVELSLHLRATGEVGVVRYHLQFISGDPQNLLWHGRQKIKTPPLRVTIFMFFCGLLSTIYFRLDSLTKYLA